MGRNADSMSEQTTQSFHLRGQSVVVPKTDLLHSNGVILIDNGNGVICQQLLEGITSIQVWPSVAQVVQCQQYLSTRLQAASSASQALTQHTGQAKPRMLCLTELSDSRCILQVQGLQRSLGSIA